MNQSSSKVRKGMCFQKCIVWFVFNGTVTNWMPWLAVRNKVTVIYNLIQMQLALIFQFEAFTKVLKNVLNTGIRGLQENLKSK